MIFLRNCPSVDTCFAVSQLFDTAGTSMIFSQSTQQKATLLYPEVNSHNYDRKNNESTKAG